MKKGLAILLALIVMLSSVFVACQKKPDDTEINNSEVGGIEDADTEIELIEQDVTDESGNTVTDADGNTVTEEVAVLVQEDEKGNRVGIVLDKEGNKTDKTVKLPKSNKTTTTKKSGKNNSGKDDHGNKTVDPATPAEEPEKQDPIEDAKGETDPNSSTKTNYVVPKTGDSGKEVNINADDTTVMTAMLEVPYLYEYNYENSDGVPIGAASHAALWMLHREGLGMTSYPSGTVVLDLFKYFGQTVVNFKSKCNGEGTSLLEYKENTDTFSVSAFENKQQEVEITKVEDLGNNYFRVTGKVSNAKGKNKVVAIMQKNKLDLSLGFSIKALKWS